MKVFMDKIPIIMDCDPGHDDAIALVLAFSSPKLDVRAVTMTGGNQTVEKTLRNARKVLSYIGVRPPLARGADKPMFRELETAASVHGESGLDGPSIPDTDYREDERPAADLMRDIILESPEPVTLVPTGPLTNIGILLSVYPEVKRNIRGISLMGGAVLGGNWTAAAEFNILVDPEAADIVFTSGLPIVMSGLDVTHKAYITKAEVEAIRSLGDKVPVLVAELLDFFFKFHDARGYVGAPLHDPCAVAYLIAPEIFSTHDYHIRIETSGEFTTGATVADRTGVTGKSPNVKASMGVDREAFIRLLTEACASYNERGRT
jgi:pyrimidine-specific ribonucleoside hydrolase